MKNNNTLHYDFNDNESRDRSNFRRTLKMIKIHKKFALIFGLLAIILLSLIYYGISARKVFEQRQLEPAQETVEFVPITIQESVKNVTSSTTTIDDVDSSDSASIQNDSRDLRYGYNQLQRGKRAAAVARSRVALQQLKTPTAAVTPAATPAATPAPHVDRRLRALIANIRRRRQTQVVLNRLQRQYARCKKEAPDSNNCRASFARMYAMAKEFAERMEQMKELLEDQHSEKWSNETQESESLQSIESSTGDGGRGAVLTTTKATRTATSAAIATAWSIEDNSDSDSDSESDTDDEVEGVSSSTARSVTKKQDDDDDDDYDDSEDSEDSVDTLVSLGFSDELITDSTTKTTPITASAATTTEASSISTSTRSSISESTTSSSSSITSGSTLPVNFKVLEDRAKPTQEPAKALPTMTAASAYESKEDENEINDDETRTKPKHIKYSWIIDGDDSSEDEDGDDDDDDEDDNKSNGHGDNDGDDDDDIKSNDHVNDNHDIKSNDHVNDDRDIKSGGHNGNDDDDNYEDNYGDDDDDEDDDNDDDDEMNNLNNDVDNDVGVESDHDDNNDNDSDSQLNERDFSQGLITKETEGKLGDNSDSSGGSAEGFGRTSLENSKPVVSKVDSDEYQQKQREWMKELDDAAGLYKADEFLRADNETETMPDKNNAEPQLNPINGRNLNMADRKLLSICERVALKMNSNGEAAQAAQSSNRNWYLGAYPGMRARNSADMPPLNGQAQIRPKITGETMKATMQFMPQYGQMQMLPQSPMQPQQLSVPICFTLNLANVGVPVYRPISISPAQMPGYMGSSVDYKGFGGMYGSPSVTAFGPSSGTGSGMPAMPFNRPKNAATNGGQPYFCSYTKNAGQNRFDAGTQHGEDNNAQWRSAAAAAAAGNNLTDAGNIIYASFAPLQAKHIESSSTPCANSKELPCLGGNVCIAASSWCDNMVDCPDGSDEAYCTCQDRLTPQLICDGYKDCPLGEDEIGCFGCEKHMYSCYENAQEYAEHNHSTLSMCYSKLERCDDIFNCLNRRDELECNILIKDPKNLMLHAISGSEGLLYHNQRGDWYPVCNNGKKWARAACENEDLNAADPEVTFREIYVQGPFAEPALHGNVLLAQSCQQRDSNGKLTDRALHVRCAPPVCGISSKSTRQARRRQMLKEQSAVSSNATLQRSNRGASNKNVERIVGGTYVKDLQWPFVAALYRNGHFHCGGTIYTERWILTAAHCVINHAKYYYEVRAGLLRRTSYSAATQVQPVANVIAHEGYERATMRHDIALLRLVLPLQFNRWVKPICLPAYGRTSLNKSGWLLGPAPQTLCTAVGWGAMRERGPNSDHLLQVVIPIRKECPDRVDRESQAICAGDANGGRDACQGDSGGPLLCRSVSNANEWYLAGIVSHGNGCARRREFGVYTRVALYLGWIETAMQGESWKHLAHPQQKCPGHMCVWGGSQCIQKRKRCDRIVDCLGSEDEIGCSYNFVPDIVGARRNVTMKSAEVDSMELKSTTQQRDEMEIETDSSTTAATLLKKFLKNIENVFKPEASAELSTNMTETPTSSETSTTTVKARLALKPHTKPIEGSKSSRVESTTKRRSFTAAFQLPRKFICRNIPQFIELDLRCDKQRDCEDGTDEQDCSCRDLLRGAHAALICDGKIDCPDGSDEINCANCTNAEFYCIRSRICLPLEQRCDNNSDCHYNEDEKYCVALTNGRELNFDKNRQQQPEFAHSGIISRNRNGNWRVLCLQEFPNFNAAHAQQYCAQLGFKGYAYYNFTELGMTTTQLLATPIAPELLPKRTAMNDFNEQHDNNNNKFAQYKEHKLHNRKMLYMAHERCRGIYLECKLQSNRTAPRLLLSAGESVDLQQANPSALTPVIEPNQKPNAHLKPPALTRVIAKTDALNDRLGTFIAKKRKQKLMLVNDALYTVVEEPHWPWLARIYVDGELCCLGILVQLKFVLVHDACVDNIDFAKHYVAVLLGGVKAKQFAHYDPNEQIIRVSCFTQPENVKATLLHLQDAAQPNEQILPLGPSQLAEYDADDMKQECFAVLQERDTGRTKTVGVVEEYTSNANCKRAQNQHCYRLVEQQPTAQLMQMLNVSAEDMASLSEELEFVSGAAATEPTPLSKYTSCTHFGEPNDQGLLICRTKFKAWYPMAVFDYDNTNCSVFKQAIAMSTLDDLGERFDAATRAQCKVASFKCASHQCALGQCLNETQVCNGHNDCHDGSDERSSMCDQQKQRCPASEMKCAQTSKCIPVAKFCDHVVDCADWSDEPMACSCLTYLQAADPGRICDGVINCYDRSDESPALCNCTSTRFRCGNTNECIPMEAVCDKQEDCTDGEDEQHCNAIEYPQTASNAHEQSAVATTSYNPTEMPKYGQLLERSYGVWSTKCLPKSSPLDMADLRLICRRLGYSPFRLPSFRLIDDETNRVIKTVEYPDRQGRSFGNDSIPGSYREATKTLVVNKFSPLRLNPNLTLFLKSSRPIARIARWNATDSRSCYRIELQCG